MTTSTVEHGEDRRPARAAACALAAVHAAWFVHLRHVLTAASVVLVALVASGCGSSADPARAADAGTPRRGGTAWMETSQEPPVLNPWLAAGGMSVTDLMTSPLRSAWIVVDDHGRWTPQLATTVPTVANGGVRLLASGGMRVDFAIQPRAAWSDGAPITCLDMRFTWQTVMDDRWPIGSRVGWEQITRIDCSDPRHVSILLRRRHAPYLAHLLATAPLPRHALAGKDFSRVWNNAITVSSGPFVFDSWHRGDRLVLRRNPRWWGARAAGHEPWLDRIVVRFVPDASTMKLDLRMEDADIVGLPADTNLPHELASVPTATYDVHPGSGWENLTFNTARFPLDDARVRRAVAFAVDRQALVDVVLRRQVPRLDSTLPPYLGAYSVPLFDRYRRDQGQVDQLMRAAGWRRDGHDPWTDRRGRRARLAVTTMSGNPLRAKTVQLIAAQLEDAGFVTDVTMAKPEVYFGSIVVRGRFDLALYSFTQGLDPSQTKFFACSEVPRAPEWRGKNNAMYCRHDVDELLAAGDSEVVPAKRARLVRQLTERLADDLPILPLYQQPDTLAWGRRLHGVRPNPMGKHLWNVDSWWVTDP